MQLWIIFTISAAFVQNLRFMLQRNLNHSGLTPTGATFARFIFGAPIAAILLFILLTNFDYPLPNTQAKFFLYCTMGGIAQILATILTIKIFKKRNFSIGIIFTKTEVIRTAIVGFLFLGESLSAYGALAILISFLGLIFLSRPKKLSNPTSISKYFNQTSLIGLGAGAFFGFSAVGYRAASLSLIDGNFIIFPFLPHLHSLRLLSVIF